LPVVVIKSRSIIVKGIQLVCLQKVFPLFGFFQLINLYIKTGALKRFDEQVLWHKVPI